MPPKKKRELVRFRPRLQDKRRRQICFAAKEWASKLAEGDKGSYYNQEKWLKDDKAPEKPIETTTELSLMSSSASRATGSRGDVFVVRINVASFTKDSSSFRPAYTQIHIINSNIVDS